MTNKIILINQVESPIKEKHISWFAQSGGFKSNKIQLMEVYEAFYKHPDAPDHAIISRIETRCCKEFDKCSIDASHLLLLEQILNTVSKIEKLETEERKFINSIL